MTLVVYYNNINRLATPINKSLVNTVFKHMIKYSTVYHSSKPVDYYILGKSKCSITYYLNNDNEITAFYLVHDDKVLTLDEFIKLVESIKKD